MLIAVPVMLSSCANVPLDGRSGVHYYFGLVRVVFPRNGEMLTAFDVKTLGVGFDGAAFAGWRDSQFMFAKADDCRVIIILKSKMELGHLRTLLDNLGEKPCVADYSHSLPLDANLQLAPR